MHFWFLLLLSGFLLVHVISRPQQADYNNDSDLDETEEEDDADPAADMYSAEDTRLNDQGPVAQENEAPRNRHLDLSQNKYMQRIAPDDNTARVKSDSLSDARVMRNRDLPDENNSDLISYNEQSRLFPKRHQSNKYSDVMDEQRYLEDSATNDISKSSHIQSNNPINKRTVGFNVGANEEGDMIFEKNNRDQISHINKNEYNGNMPSDVEQQRYFKQYYNTMQAENREVIDDKSHDGAHYNLRDRREVKVPTQLETSQKNKASNPKADNEDEESAIKRHIKKLSSEELEQLLSSLTEEKRELLKKIIDDTDSNPNAYINKREITKKAEAVEEINYMENCQSDLSKTQGGSSSLDVSAESASSQSTDATEGSKQQQDSQTDNPDLSSKSSESNLVSKSNIELTNQNDDASQIKSDNSLNTFSLNLDSKNQADVGANAEEKSKTDNKREVNLEDLEEADESLDVNRLLGQDYSNDQGYLNSENENFENMLDNENRQHEDKAYKREIFYDKQSELSDSFKSLEDSFPNSNAYDDSGSYSGPLVRVKRKNYDQVVNKRSVGIPESKVAYLPYKEEAEEEENDEGNEFEDEGFYDRTSNLANTNRCASDLAHKSENSIQTRKNSNNPKLSKNNVDSDAMSLGSDTDSVLSGVEGVDDNLMYSSGTRNRRTPDDKLNVVTQSKIETSTILAEGNGKSALDNYVNAPHYQENDAFGPLPRGYDGDLIRYKRIRRVKQPSAEEQDSTGT